MTDTPPPGDSIATPSAGAPAPVSRAVRPLPSKWKLLATFWLLQALVVYLGGALWLCVMGDSLESLWAVVTNIQELGDGLTDRGLVMLMAVYIPGVTALQALLLMPVRRPRPVRERGTSLWLSIGVAGLAIAAMWTAFVLSVVSLVYLASRGEAEWIDKTIDSIGLGSWIMLIPLLAGWAVATPLLVMFCHGKRRETFLARLATRILQGTAVEVIAIIPLAVMVRRRTSCCCDTGTFWALTLLGTVGVVLAGPAVAYTVLSKRRRRWYDGKCEVCGYDMSGLRNADRCPECGCGWAAAPAGTAGGNS